MRAYDTMEITLTIQRIFLPLGRELEVVLLQVARRGGVPKANYECASPISIGSDVCKISKCSYIESIFMLYCNWNLLITQLVNVYYVMYFCEKYKFIYYIRVH